MSHEKITKLMKRGSDFLGVKYPILCGAMTWISEPKLVSAVSNHGCFGCLAGGNAPTDVLLKYIEETKSLTDKPFAVNLITIAPAYKEHLAMIKDIKVPFIIFAGSFPKEKEIEAAKETGAKVMCFASTVSIAERMIRFGADAIILEGSEAGGHIGHVSSVIWMQQVLYKFADQIPMFMAGGMSTGKMMAHALLMGAAGVQLGTRFLAAEECGIHPHYKELVLKASDTSTIVTGRRLGHPVRSLKTPYSRNYAKLEYTDISAEELEALGVGSLRKAAADGDEKEGCYIAGQIAGMVNRVQTAAEIIGEIMAQTEQVLKNAASFIK